MNAEKQNSKKWKKWIKKRQKIAKKNGFKKEQKKDKNLKIAEKDALMQIEREKKMKKSSEKNDGKIPKNCQKSIGEKWRGKMVINDEKKNLSIRKVRMKSEKRKYIKKGLKKRKTGKITTTKMKNKDE